MNDRQLQQAAIDALEFDPSLDSTHIGVSVTNAVVTLSGYVENFAQKHAAEEAVRKVRGVRALALELEVRFPGDKKYSDDEIAARAVKLIEWDLRLPRDVISVTVENGIVELGGTVDWHFIRRDAESDVRRLGGVVDVRNHIAVRNTSAQATPQKIVSALDRAATLNSKLLSVTLGRDGAVVLAGSVRNLQERDEVEMVAWSAPGVAAVVNRLEILT